MQNTIAVEGLGLPGMVQATMPLALGQPERRWTFRALLPNCVGLIPVAENIKHYVLPSVSGPS